MQFIWRNLRDLLLPGEVLRVLDGRDHLVDGEEGGEVGGVGGDDDQGEEPPDGAHYPRAGSLRVQTRPLQTSTISTIYLIELQTNLREIFTTKEKTPARC